MIPVGYMAKRVLRNDGWLKAPVEDFYSVSACLSQDFADYIDHWKHNGYWFFNSPEVIREVASAKGVELDGTSLFYYETYEEQFDEGEWEPFSPEASFTTAVVMPERRTLEGFDVVSFYCKTSPECSPLGCNHMAEEIATNRHCLLDSFELTKFSIDQGKFKDCEPGPYRILAVYSVCWPKRARATS
jgi:hypothetical protein